MQRWLACLQQSGQAKSASCPDLMRLPLAIAAAALVGAVLSASAEAVSLDQACQRFADKLSEAQASGDQQKAQAVYNKGSQRIASKFNGATCPNVQPPTP
jgi:hypothetical protein